VLAVTRVINARNEDVVAVKLIPKYHLLGTRGAVGRVVLTPHRGLRCSDGCGGGRAGDHAFITPHEQVELATSVRNPSPCADAAVRWACWHIGGHVERGDKFVGGVVRDREYGHVAGSSLRDIAYIGDRERATCRVTLVLGMHVRRGEATVSGEGSTTKVRG